MNRKIYPSVMMEYVLLLSVLAVGLGIFMQTFVSVDGIFNRGFSEYFSRLTAIVGFPFP